MSSLPTTTEIIMLGAPIVLRDGSRIRLRQIRDTDKDLLLRGFERLSEESRYRRFLVPTPKLTEQTVRYLTEVDHRNHEAIVAIDERSGEGVGVARYVRDPQRPGVAEVAVTVTDDWQGRGVGTVLLDALSARARDQGVKSFTALMLSSNAEMLDMFRRLGTVRIVDREAGTIEIELPIPRVGLSPALRKLLQVAARADAEEIPGNRRRPVRARLAPG